MLTKVQVTALTAQAAAAAKYVSRDDNDQLLPDWQLNDSGQDVYTGTELATRGVGIYGQSPSSLILTEYLKPATLNLITTPSMTATVLASSSVWTGQFGINSLLDYLNTPILQNIGQIALLVGAYQGLLDAGYITGSESDRDLAALLQPSAKYGVTAVIDWIEGRTAPDLTSNIEIAARQGQYAIDFVAVNANQLEPGAELGAFDATVIRDELDLVTTEIIGNDKIPPIEYADIVATLVDRISDPNITRFPTTDEDGKFRFAPGASRG
jgi:hypothetical protein